jgi:prepilin-type N-terminal cleavage/methylation domain-containing protein
MLSRVRKSLQGGFTLIELMIVVAIIGILAVAAIPAFVRYMRQAKTVEANEGLSKVVDGASAWYQAEHYDSCGSLAPKAFPGQQMVTGGGAAAVGCGFVNLTADWIPNDQVCSNYAGQKCPGAVGAAGTAVSEFVAASTKTDAANQQIFEALRFTLNSPHYYNFKFNAAGSDKTATFEAIACGDLNNNFTGKPSATCVDAKLGKFARTGLVDQEGGPKVNGIQINNEIE